MTSKSQALLKEIQGVSLSEQERSDLTVELATYLLEESRGCRSRKEKKQEKWLGKMMADPDGRLFITQIVDLAFRSHTPQRVVRLLTQCMRRLHLPACLSIKERIHLLLFQSIAPLFPKIFLFFLQQHIKCRLAHVLLPNNKRKRKLFLKHCRAQNIRVNLNHIGEAILGEGEAEDRLQTYLKDLEDDEVDYISIKISTLYSQIQLTAFEASVEHLAHQLRRLYRAARPHQFINLDMEEFRDLDLTLAVFKKVLSEPEFHHTSAGIVLQSYLPESYTKFQDLVAWARQRQGAPIRIRLVKGANLAMETVESSVRGWPLAPFSHKWETDANFKRILHYALQHTEYVHIGIASHNLFDIAYALILREETETKHAVEFEMLGGMAPAMSRAVLNVAEKLTLYCPQTESRHFQHAVSYLIRRLDENSGVHHFLRHFFHLRPGSFLWEQEVKKFRYACAHCHTLDTTSHRSLKKPTDHEQDTDFSLETNRICLTDILTPKTYDDIPLVVGGKIMEGETREGLDPSTGICLYRYHIADHKHIDHAFRTATMHCPQNIWENVVQIMRQRRNLLIQAMLADGGKTIPEADAEVSEAIDFIRYYSKLETRVGTPKGIILVAPPWNFPAAIPTGGIVAALLTGNAVILKPAPETVLVGWEIAKIFWEGGVPKTALQFLPCDENLTGDYLISHPQLASVILTGATATAKHFLTLRPGIDLMAETGGKNAMIISSVCDRDLAIRDLISSAFSHGGQKCSACSLAILEEELYKDVQFLEQLKDATESLYVGSSWDSRTRIPPLIRSPGPELLRALTHLDAGESWLVKPRKIKDNLWTPGIKLGVTQGSFFHQTECFGPVLGVMCAQNLEHALELANSTPYGLTSGLHSLDPQEQILWRQQIIAGNLYINRNIVGAVVGRQPFGGCKESSFGPGAKAGGPLYCHQLVTIEDQPDKKRGVLPQSLVPFLLESKLNPQERVLWQSSVESYAYWNKFYQKPQEIGHLVGQDNLYYMVPKKHITLRYRGEPIVDLLRVIAACLIAGTPYTLSSSQHLGLGEVIEDDIACFSRPGPIRALSKEKSPKSSYVIESKVLSSGKFEMRHYLREISLSFDYHRYGYLGFHERTPTQP